MFFITLQKKRRNVCYEFNSCEETMSLKWKTSTAIILLGVFISVSECGIVQNNPVRIRDLFIVDLNVNEHLIKFFNDQEREKRDENSLNFEIRKLANSIHDVHSLHNCTFLVVSCHSV